MSYSIKIQDTTGLWIVTDDDTGKIISRGASPSVAVNLAIQKGMPSAEKDQLLNSAESQQTTSTQPAPPATAATAASDDAPKGPNAPPQAQVSDNGRIVPPPDTTTPSNAIPPATSENAEGATTGTNAPTKTFEQTQATYYENDGTSSTSNTALKAPAVGANAEGDAGEAEAQAAIKPGVGTKDDAATPNPTNTQAVVNANDFKLVKVVPQPNVLDQYPSSNYIASVYLLNDAQYKRLIASDVKKIDGYQLLFQSGGAGVSDGVIRAPSQTVYENDGTSSTTEINYPSANRNPYFANDFYIDSLSISTLTHGKGSGSAHSSTDIKFTVVEPQGMTMLERLRDAVANHAPQCAGGAINYVAATFLLVIRFYGYDQNGSIIQPIKGGMLGNDVTSDPKAAVEKFIPFLIKNINWSVGTKTVSYDWECAPVGQYLGGYSDRGTVPFDMQLNASSVELMLGGPATYSSTTTSPATPGASTTNAKTSTPGFVPVGGNNTANQQATVRRIDNATIVPASSAQAERDDAAAVDAAAPQTAAAAPTTKKTVVQGLMAALNDFQKQAVEDGKIEQADVYSVEFVGPDANLIAGASLNTLTGKYDKTKTPAGVNGPGSINPDTNSVDPASRSSSITAGQQIIQVLELVLRNSQYITKQALFEIDRYGNQVPTKKPTSNDQVRWYSISMSATQRSDKIDKKRNAFAYDIKYTISPYLIKNLNSVYFPVNSFSGVHKSYPYWFTGQNVAVLEYQENLNVLYKATLNGSKDDKSSADRIKGAQTSNLLELMSFSLASRSGESSQGALGRTFDLTANAAEQLYDPASLRSVKVKIIGDPAWVQQGSVLKPTSVSTVGASAFTTGFNPDGSISYDTQDILFEVNWQPPEDYNLSTGLADPYSGKQSSVQKQYNTKTSKISRVYIATKVTSTFRQGRFEQELEGVLYQFAPVTLTANAAPGGSFASSSDIDAERASNAAAVAASNKARGNNQTQATGNRIGLELTGRIQNNGLTDPRSTLSSDGGTAAILGAQQASPTGAYNNSLPPGNSRELTDARTSWAAAKTVPVSLQNAQPPMPVTDGNNNVLDTTNIESSPPKLNSVVSRINAAATAAGPRGRGAAPGNPTSSTIPNNQLINKPDY